MRLAVVATLSCFTLIVCGPAIGSEQTSASKTSSSRIFDGYKGYQGIRTDPAHVVGEAFVHPTQMDVGPVGGNFVAIGTYKGKGALGCADDYNAKWSMYTDGQIGGMYFCNTEVVNAYDAGENPFFRIEWGFCPSAGANRWQMYFGGVLRACINSVNATSSRAIAMIEVVSNFTYDRNIDIVYSALQHRNVGQAYVGWGTASEGISPDYNITQPSGTTKNVYLPPLD